MLVAALFVHLVMSLLARRKRGSHAADESRWKAESLVALFALGVAVVFGLLALPSNASKPLPIPTALPTSVPTAEPTGSPTSPPPAMPSTSPPTHPAVYDVAEILDVADRTPFADVKVRVSGLPSAGTKHLLVAVFDGKWQLKGEVPAKIGTHVIPADLSQATVGRWREFYVVRADIDAARKWEASKDSVLSALPTGTKKIAGPMAHQKPYVTE